MPFDKWIRLLNSNYYIYTYYFIYDLRVFNFLHKKGIHLQRVTALTINFQFNSISHRVRFDFNGISFSLHIELLEIYRELMCIVGCWWCTQRPQKAIWDSEKYLISVKETKQPWIWKFSLLHHGGSLQVAKWKGGMGAEIRLPFSYILGLLRRARGGTSVLRVLKIASKAEANANKQFWKYYE